MRCRRCECPDMRRVDTIEVDDITVARAYRCRNCGTIMYETLDREAKNPQKAPQDNKVAQYHIIVCDICGSSDTKIYRTVRPYRYHKCNACGHSFKSKETKG